jgi:hypothetical protein
MLEALLSLRTDERHFSVDVIDVDSDPEALAKYDELVPVLFGDLDAPALCHYFLDKEKVEAYLDKR